MNGAGQQFLAGAGFTLDQDAAVAGGDLGEHVEKTAHQGAVTDHVPDLKAPGDFLAQFLYPAQVAEGFRAADDLEAALADEGRLWLVADESRFRQRFEPNFVRTVWDRMELVGCTAGVLVFRSIPAVESAVSRPSGALFGGALLLERYDLGTAANRPAGGQWGDLLAVPGEGLDLTLHWQASRPLAEAKADLFKALANPARIRIVEVLGVGSFSVGEIQLRLGLELSLIHI